MKSAPRVTFGVIVLNGEPLTRYCVRSLYPFAHEIIVVEGAAPAAAGIATADGHSRDGTLETLAQFKEHEDPENKLVIVKAEDDGHPNGFWPGEKDEQSQAYARRATGDYLWQVDIDEFYRPEDIVAIQNSLQSDPSITQVNVQWLNFWGGFDYVVDGLFVRQHYRHLGAGVPRIFKWGPGYRYVRHRPPTVEDANGVDARSGNWVKGDRLAQKGIYCYHYATVFPDSVRAKMQYYSRGNWKGHDKLDEWCQSNFTRIRRPFRVHHVVQDISWLSRYHGDHPPAIQQLIFDLDNGTLENRLRDTDDIERILSQRRYLLASNCLRVLTPLLLDLRNHLPRIEKYVEKSIEKLFSPSIPDICPTSHSREGLEP